MEFDEALGMLGVSLSADDTSVRRAYLRAVKAHPPERDPVAFQKVREAYEVVRDQIRWRRYAADSSDSLEESEELGEAPLEEGRPAPSESLDPDPPFSAAEKLDDQEDEPAQIAELRNRLDATADAEEAVTIARDAVRQLPDSTEARWLLIEALDTAEREEQAAEEFLVAHRAKLSGFTVPLLYRAPELLDIDELRTIAASEEPAVQQAAAQALSNRGHGLEAARIELKLLSADSGEAPANLGFSVELVLKLIAEGALAPARDIAQAIRGVLESSGSRLEGIVGARWLLVSELLAVEAAAPAAALRAMARVSAGGEMALAEGVFERLKSAEGKQLVRLKRALDERAPNLNTMFGALIEPPQRRSGTSFTGLPWGLMGGIVFVLLQALRWCASDDSRPPAKPATEQRERR